MVWRKKVTGSFCFIRIGVESVSIMAASTHITRNIFLRIPWSIFPFVKYLETHISVSWFKDQKTYEKFGFFGQNGKDIQGREMTESPAKKGRACPPSSSLTLKESFLTKIFNFFWGYSHSELQTLLARVWHHIITTFEASNSLNKQLYRLKSSYIRNLIL